MSSPPQADCYAILKNILLSWIDDSFLLKFIIWLLSTYHLLAILWFLFSCISAICLYEYCTASSCWRMFSSPFAVISFNMNSTAYHRPMYQIINHFFSDQKKWFGKALYNKNSMAMFTSGFTCLFCNEVSMMLELQNVIYAPTL